jgi:hypothetical protein
VAKRLDRIARPTKRTEFEIVAESSQAQKGWRDLSGTTRNGLADAWDSLTQNPLRNDEVCHPLKGRLAVVTVGGVSHIQRQYELNGGARIWYYVTEGTPGLVHLINVHTNHPNATK